MAHCNELLSIIYDKSKGITTYTEVLDRRMDSIYEFMEAKATVGNKCFSQ